MGRLDDVDEAVFSYVIERLKKETGVRSAAAKICRETGTSSATLSNIVNGKRGISWDFARKMARYWDISVEELEKVAVQTASERAPKVAAERRRIRDRAEWAVELEKARLTRDGPELEEYFQEIGDMIDTLRHDLDAIGLLELAQSLRGLAKRALTQGANDASGKMRR